MSLRDVMDFLQKQQANGAAVSPVSPETQGGDTPKPAWIGAVPHVSPVSPHLCVTPVTAPIERLGAAAVQQPHHQCGITFCAHLKGPVPVPGQHSANTVPAPEHPAAVQWSAMDKAYQAHHFKCPVCIAAGKGYGLRCGVGAALWTAYSEAGEQPGALVWHQPKKDRRHD